MKFSNPSNFLKILFWLKWRIGEMDAWITRNSKIILIIFWGIILGISLIAIFSGDSFWINKKLEKSQGEIALGLVMGFFFFSIGWYFDNEDKKRDEAKKEEKKRYQWMLDFLDQSGSYNFSTVNYLSKKGTPLCYELIPAKIEGKLFFLDDTISKRYVLTVKNIAHRKVLDNSDLADYIGGPLVVGNSYYISFYDGDWHLENGIEDVLIRKHGKMGRCITVPNPNEVINQAILNLHSYHNMGSLIVSPNGKINFEGGEIATIFKSLNGKSLFIQIGQGTRLRMVFRTYMKWDFRLKNELLGIENVEGIFDSPYSLFVFKNCLRGFCQEKNIEIPFFDHWELLNTNWQ